MTQGSNELHFFYDAQNRPAVVVYNGTAYAYVKSLQGDIVAILDENGNTVVSYGYDAWGAPLWCTGELAETLGKVQPFRYRGYVFDEETGVYYLRSRYFSAERCRFVNADSVISGDLYMYCKNEPVGRADISGFVDYATIGSDVNLFELIYNQETILAYVPDFLAEQQRIIDAGIPYVWKEASDAKGYDCATYISKPLQVCSTQKTNGKTKYIKCETGITRMLQNKRDCFLFIARLEDYSLDEIPEGALFLRSKGYNGFSTGHGATFSQRISASELVINHAANSDDGIQNKTLTFEQLKQQYEYIAWPRGLGTLETAVCRSAFSTSPRFRESFRPIAYRD